MSREIKFRAWLKDAECFAEIRHISFFKGKTVVKIYDQPMSEEVWFELEDLELLQYTGLKDKNGVDIYEGDILEAADGYKGVIEYHSLRAQFVGRNVGNNFFDEEFDTLYTSDGNFNSAKVIGNIYENKNLLEEK